MAVAAYDFMRALWLTKGYLFFGFSRVEPLGAAALSVGMAQMGSWPDPTSRGGPRASPAKDVEIDGLVSSRPSYCAALPKRPALS
jgi:hypothetical protein